MRYHLLATDYDATLATDGRVAAETTAALEAVLATGRRLMLVTGRRLEELMSLYPELEIFERVVAEMPPNARIFLKRGSAAFSFINAIWK